MADPFLAEIRLFGFNFAPRGWALCQGQIVPITQNQALFSLLGVTYGGNGQTNFGLPDFRGRAPLHWGQGPGLQNFSLGQAGGETNHQLVANEIPAHSHVPQATAATADQTSPAGNTWAASPAAPYAPFSGAVDLSSAAIAAAGGYAPHPNEQPYLALNFCIALQGIFPSRS
jgi:microcystin-dependent protein